jgi:hypothetical protein
MRQELRTLALAGVFAVISSEMAGAVDADLGRFATAKQNQVREYAATITNKIPSIVWSLFDAVRVDDWETATNLGARLSKASGRYTTSVTNESLSPALWTLIWPPISEMIGTYDQFHNWDNKWLHRFGREIIDSIPKGSIYFGGTDPGRFIISALSESHAEGKPFFTLTQNQLADQTYLEYLRKMYGNKLYIPTVADLQTAFQEYLTDAEKRLKNGKLKPGEDVRVIGGRVQVSGQVAVMEINGLLVRIILNRNRERQFYLEESFALEWMYPFLSPHGLIFELHAKPLSELREDVVRKDQDYWKDFTGELIGDWITGETSVRQLCDFVDKAYLNKDLTAFKGDIGFAKNDETQKCLSKLRSSIAGLYVWRAEQARDADERSRMEKAASLAFRQAYALCPYSPEAVFRFTKQLTNLKRQEDAFLIGKTSLRLDPDNASLQGLVRSLNKGGQ